MTQPTVVSVMHTIIAPADDIRTAGTLVKPLENVSVQTVTVMSDGTQQVSKTAEGIQYKVTYQMNASVVETDLMLPEGMDLVIADTGIYKITYTYTDALGNTTQYVRTITAAAAPAAAGV